MLNKVDVSMMWGPLFLVIKLSLYYPRALNRINCMVKIIGSKLEYMNKTMQTLKSPDQQKKNRDKYVEVFTSG